MLAVLTAALVGNALALAGPFTEDAGPALSRTAFIVRMAANDKDVSKISNAVEWAKDLQQKSPEVDFWLSVDATQDHSEFTQGNWSQVPAAGNQLIRLAPTDKFNAFAQKD